MSASGGGGRSAELLRIFNTAVGLHTAGRLKEAATLYAGLLRQLPKHPDVLDFYGTACHQLGDHDTALRLITQSVRVRPLAAMTRNRLGAVWRVLGQRDAAAWSFRRAAMVDPRLTEPAVNIATSLIEQGQAEPALAWCRRALVAHPESFDARLRHGIALNALGRFEEALPDLEVARRSQPLHPEVLLYLASARAKTGDLAGAFASARAGIIATPTVYELYTNMTTFGALLFEEGAFVPWARRAVCLLPSGARLWSVLGAELYRGSDPVAAMRAASRAVVLDPVDEGGWQTLAAAAFQCNLLARARAACRRGLAAHPRNADISYSLAEVEFIDGDLGSAWDLHETRVERQVFRPRLALPPAWRGPGTESGPLLVASEQGVGDEVIFLSCLPDLLRHIQVPVVVEVDRRIVPVMTRTFPEVTVIARQLVPGDALGQFFDYAESTQRFGLRHAVFAGSLPRFFRRDRRQPTPQGGYLKPDPERVAHWRAELGRFRPDRVVGVVWRSALMTKYRARHHASILDWAPVFTTPGCTFVNLMHGDVQPELDLLRQRTGAVVHRLPGIDLWNDIDDLLALLAALNLVVAARTANCAFAAAVGAPTIRVAQSFSRISDGRDFFFSNVWTTLPRDQAFDARAAAAEAGRLLRERVTVL